MKAFVRRHFEDFVNAGRAEVIRENMTPDFLDHDGPGGNRTVENIVAEDDRVVCRNIWRSNDAATGHPMEFHGFVGWRFEGNKIAERWATVTDPRRVQ